MDRAKNIIIRIKTSFRSLSLKTQLLLILFLLLAMTIGSLTVIYARSEGALIERISDNIEDITKAIQISVEELTYRGDSTARLKGYVEMLNKKGIKEISIIGDNAEVIASSNPRKIGTKENLSGEKRTWRKKDLMITARLGEESKKETQRLYNVIMPVSIKGQNVGYILISMILDDYKQIGQKNHIKRVLGTLFAFSIGIIISLLIAEKYTEPIKKIAQASKRIAEGELVKIRDKNRKDEIGILIKSYNEMVDKLIEQKALEEKLKKTEQLSMIGQISSGIAHEIRNPLNFLSLSIGHIKERISEARMEDKDELLKLLDDLTKEIHKVNELIHNFLFLGKPITLHKEWIIPEQLIEEALYIVKDKIQSGIDINVINTNEKTPIYCDREYMRICILNILLNAMQAVDGRGAITIECGNDNGYSSIIIHDTGPGIPEGEMERIFEPYYSTKQNGMGLGLAITKRFVEEHNGQITVESTPGQGTTMRIKVPYHEA